MVPCHSKIALLLLNLLCSEFDKVCIVLMFFGFATYKCGNVATLLHEAELLTSQSKICYKAISL